MPEKKTLSIEEIEAQSVLELPDREVLQTFSLTGPFNINIAVAVNVCPAVAAGAGTNVATTNCAAAAIAIQNVG